MLSIEQLTGRDPSQLIPLPVSLATKKDQLIHPDALKPLLELQQLAANDNVSFQVISSYRSFNDQKNIWNRKFSGELTTLNIDECAVDIDRLCDLEKAKAIMLYSALPGASRHHWGSDFDIFPTKALAEGYHPQLLASEFDQGGIAETLNLWLAQHLPSTVFFRPYNKYQQGIASEPWHISFLPISEPALSKLSLDDLVNIIRNEENFASKQIICKNIRTLYDQYINNICSKESQ